MSDIKDWWINWAPYWEILEDRHLSKMVTEKFVGYVKSPVLVIGAGQGIIVNYLKELGHVVDGVDLEPEMIRIAKERRNLDIIHADARKMPFNDGSYKTVIIASGVVDYGTPEDVIKEILDESKRVTAKGGNLFVSFYQIHPVLEKLFKKIGVIDKNSKYRMQRIFQIDDMTKVNPLKCVGPIMKWTGKNFFSVMFTWTKLGIHLPKELKEEREKSDMVFEQAAKMNVSKDQLRSVVPDILPYREVSAIKELLSKSDFDYDDFNRYEDCVIVRYFKTPDLDVDKKKN